MWRYFTLRKISSVFLETFLLACCGQAVYFFSERPSSTAECFYFLGKALAVALVFQLSLHLNDAYNFFGRQISARFFWRLVRAVVLAVLVSHFIFFALPWLTVERSVFAWNLILASLFVFLWHTIVRPYLWSRQPQTNLLALGLGNLTLTVVREIMEHPELGIRVVGFVTDAAGADDVPGVNAEIIGNYADLPELVAKHEVNRITVGLSDSRKKLPIKELLDFKTKGILIDSVEDFFERVTGKIPVENLRPSWLVFNSGFNISKHVFLQKRILSILLSIALLIMTSPILLLTMIAIKLDSKGPVFYKQKRVGRNGRVFKLVKFRSMRQDAEKGTGPVWSTQENDGRVTRVGRFLRRVRIDELPQIFNVLRGDMDMVGPRPERPFFVEQLSREIPYYPLRHVVKPGISGWAQVNYGYANKLEHTVEKLQYDLFYIKNISLAL
ncbi:MAG: TIGR03013 family PEP-CTERM/XrtA system glycosyltransferase, partial [Acidobacteria bacterium]|nr:TIGR03013 family PEP-CTERM/XrtA system glycosyltransferase [Acidobacteriota bacterium]